MVDGGIQAIGAGNGIQHVSLHGVTRAVGGCMTTPEVERLQATLRQMLDSRTLTLRASRRGGPVQALIGDEVVGTLDAVTDEDGTSWVLTVAVLAEDLV